MTGPKLADWALTHGVSAEDWIKANDAERRDMLNRIANRPENYVKGKTESFLRQTDRNSIWSTLKPYIIEKSALWSDVKTFDSDDEYDRLKRDIDVIKDGEIRVDLAKQLEDRADEVLLTDAKLLAFEEKVPTVRSTEQAQELMNGVNKLAYSRKTDLLDRRNQLLRDATSLNRLAGIQPRILGANTPGEISTLRTSIQSVPRTNRTDDFYRDLEHRIQYQAETIEDARRLERDRGFRLPEVHERRLNFDDLQKAAQKAGYTEAGARITGEVTADGEPYNIYHYQSRARYIPSLKENVIEGEVWVVRDTEGHPVGEFDHKPTGREVAERLREK